MRTFLVELTIDVDDDEPITEREIEKFLSNLDPQFGVVTVQNIDEAD